MRMNHRVVIFDSFSSNKHRDLMLVPIIIVSVVAAWLAALYNRFVRARNLTKEAWGGIDAQLKRRHDLIPRLVEAVKGSMDFEKGLLVEVTSLRTQSLSAGSVRQRGAVEQALSSSLHSLFAIAEAYPELKSNQNILDLQRNLSETEDQIQLARRYYNGTVRDFNTRIQMFPNNLVASMFGFKEAEYFELNAEAERTAPDIKL